MKFKPTSMHKMLLLLSLSLLFAVSSGLKAVQFGETRSAETLFPSSSLTSSPSSSIVPSLHDPELIEHNYTKPEDPFPDSIEDDQISIEQLELNDESLSSRGANMGDRFHNKDGNEWGPYIPIGVNDGQTHVRQAGPGGGLGKVPGYRGVVQMDCMKAPEVCKNAGFYQNCLRGAKGDYKKVLYTNGPKENDKKTPVADKNRFNSGVSTSWSTPCRAWPFAQRFWHPQELSQGPFKKSGLQTDEWPMATMTTGPFNRKNPISLRCMTNTENRAGSQEVMAFRRPEGPNYKTGGKWKRFRFGPEEQLLEGDTYNVNFNFDSFPKKGAKDYQKWADIRAKLHYAEWTKDSDCKNDWLQFHLSALRPAFEDEKSGILGSPYDSIQHNAYRIAFESGDIRQFHITLTITGKAQDQINAEVWEQYDKEQVVLVKTDTKVKPGSSFSVKGNLPKSLTIERQKNGCDFAFFYADKSDGARWFRFDTNDSGFGLGKFKAREGEDAAGQTEKYCDQKNLPGKSSGTIIEFSFPGW